MEKLVVDDGGDVEEGVAHPEEDAFGSHGGNASSRERKREIQIYGGRRNGGERESEIEFIGGGSGLQSEIVGRRHLTKPGTLGRREW